jgi:hypothetical protein
MIFVMTLLRIVCYLFPMGCFFEGFTYDALDRLTQSSTTGKIDDVDYSYAVSYQ